jgi:uncharacterized protein (DUF952 family)
MKKRFLAIIVLIFTIPGIAMAQENIQFVYKILTLSEWVNVQRHEFSSDHTSALDRQDGYIHLSTRQQIPHIFQKYFKGKDVGVIIKLDYLQLATKTKWEANSKGEMFPHFYGKIEDNYIRDVIDFDHDKLPDNY